MPGPKEQPIPPDALADVLVGFNPSASPFPRAGTFSVLIADAAGRDGWDAVCPPHRDALEGLIPAVIRWRRERYTLSQR